MITLFFFQLHGLAYCYSGGPVGWSLMAMAVLGAVALTTQN